MKLITIPSICNLAAAFGSTVPNWTKNSIQTILTETISIVPKMIYTMSTILSSIKTVSSTPLIPDTFQDWFRCFHIETADVDLPFDIPRMCYLQNI